MGEELLEVLVHVAAPAGAVGPLILTEVANGLGTPVQAISAPDDPDRLYIVEKSAFPNSVVEVATAVPAFIGYTGKAENGGASLIGKPWRIASMAEYEHYFGGAPEPRFRVEVVGATANETPPVVDMDRPRAQVAEFKVKDKTVRLTRAAGRAGRR